jgi:type IV secretory pathway VirB2 component (pilin)
MISLVILKQFAANTGECGTNTTTLDSSCLPHATANAQTIDKILSIVFGVTASMAVLVIVIAGLRYILAHGDPGATATARNAILYAVIGLLVSMAAFSIVTFVVGGVG